MRRCRTAPNVGPDVGRRSALDRNAGVAGPAVRTHGDPGGATRHDGALGIVINRPLDERPIAGLLAGVRVRCERETETCASISAGRSSRDRLCPAQRRLSRQQYRRYRRQGGAIAAPEILRDIGLGKGPRQSLVAFGYAGWGPSQLDDESRAASGTMCRRIRLWCSTTTGPRFGRTRWRGISRKEH